MDDTAALRLQAIDSHTAGEPTRIVTGGLGAVPGDTMAAKRAFLAAERDHLRTGLVREPRGHEAIVVAYLLEPTRAGAAAGVVFANDVGYLGMCGHGAIGVATALVETGRVAAAAPTVALTLDTPAGDVAIEVDTDGQRAAAVRLRNVPAFVQALDHPVDVPGLGTIPVDIAYGGNWFAIVTPQHAGVAVELGRLDDLLGVTRRIRAALAAQGIRGVHPETGEAALIDHVEVSGPVPGHAGAELTTRTFTLCPGRAYDRSPCGTGTSAKLAVLAARGALAPGGTLRNHGILDTAFIATHRGETRVGDRPAVIAEIAASAYLTGFVEFVFDPRDPLRFGAGGDR